MEAPSRRRPLNTWIATPQRRVPAEMPGSWPAIFHIDGNRPESRLFSPNHFLLAPWFQRSDHHDGVHWPGWDVAWSLDDNMDHAGELHRPCLELRDLPRGLPRPEMRRQGRDRGPRGPYQLLASGSNTGGDAATSLRRMGVLLAWVGMSGGLHDGLHGRVWEESRVADGVHPDPGGDGSGVLS
jgi:hypothetical protein